MISLVFPFIFTQIEKFRLTQVSHLRSALRHTHGSWAVQHCLRLNSCLDHILHLSRPDLSSINTSSKLYLVTWLCRPRTPLLSFRLGLHTCRLDLAYVEAYCSESLTQIG